MAGRIRITSGDAAGRVVEIDDEVVFGRKGDGPGKLPGDIEISRRHARVYLDSAGGLTIEDAGSTNGTFVGGVRVTSPWPLNPGDAVRMGETTLQVEAAVPAEPEPIDELPPWEVAEREPEPEEEPAAEPAPPGDWAPPMPGEREPEPVEPEPELVEPEPAALERAPQPAPRAAPASPPAGTGVPRPLVYVLLAVLLMAAAGIAAVVILTGTDEDEDRGSPRGQGPPALVNAATEAGCTTTDLPPEGDRTVSGTAKVTYRSDPPHSGDHAEKPASDGIWETAPPLPKVVRSLQLGRVALWHKPGDEKGQRLLREVGDQSPKHMLLLPDATMPHRVAATAWGHVLGCKTINGSTAGAVRAFRDAYRDKGPQFEP